MYKSGNHGWGAAEREKWYGGLDKAEIIVIMPSDIRDQPGAFPGVTLKMGGAACPPFTFE